MHNIKIFVDCHVFDGGFQGTTTYLKGLYQELIRDQDKEFYFAATDIANLEKIFGTHSNVTYLAYKSKNKFIRLLQDIPALIKRHNIEFAHFQYIVSPIKRCKYIVTTHDVLFIDFPEYFPVLNRIKNTFLFKWSDRFADIIFTVSGYSGKQIRHHFGIEKILITCNAVEEAFFEKYNKATVQKQVLEDFGLSEYLIYVSRWEPRKNHHLVLKAFVEKELYKDHQLLFIGDTTFVNEQYERYFRDLDRTITEKIITLKKVDFKTMLQLLRAAKVSVYPSVAEGFGIPPLESLAAGIPTVSSNATAMSDFDFLEGYLFDPHDQKDFEEKLLKAFGMSEAEIIRMQQAIKSNYTWEKSAQVYRQAIAEHKKT